jgi:hypothetical protein
MHDVLRERIRRHLEALPEAQLYQVLDYIKFLSSKYARESVRPPASPFQRFGEKLEDRLRLNRVGFGAIRTTLEAVGSADRVVSGIAEAGRSLLREVGAGAPEESAPETPPPAPSSGLPAKREDFTVDG